MQWNKGGSTLHHQVFEKLNKDRLGKPISGITCQRETPTRNRRKRMKYMGEFFHTRTCRHAVWIHAVNLDFVQMRWAAF